MTDLANVLLREVPAELLRGVRSGDFEVYGSIIRSTSSRRIVGHLQETQILGQALNVISSVGSAPIAAVGLVGQGVAIVQNEQIKAAIKVVQSLQMANLAVSAASIGVSIAGTAILLKRFSDLEKKLDSLAPQLASIAADVQMLRHETVAKDFARLSVLIEQLDGCWNQKDQGSEWREIARDAHFMAGEFKRQAQGALAASPDPLIALPIIDAYATASTIRITARLAQEETNAALEAANASAKDVAELGQPIQLGELVLKQVWALDDQMGTPAWDQRVTKLKAELGPVVKGVRDREAASAASAATIEQLNARGFSGREWLTAAREETDSPFVFLPAIEQ